MGYSLDSFVGIFSSNLESGAAAYVASINKQLKGAANTPKP